MARTTRNSSKATAQKSAEKPIKPEKKTEKVVVKCKGFAVSAENAPSALVEKAMKLNPHMKEMWITPQGFVHNANAPQYLLEGAKFYVNKYYQK